MISPTIEDGVRDQVEFLTVELYPVSRGKAQSLQSLAQKTLFIMFVDHCSASPKLPD